MSLTGANDSQSFTPAAGVSDRAAGVRPPAFAPVAPLPALTPAASPPPQTLEPVLVPFNLSPMSPNTCHPCPQSIQKQAGPPRVRFVRNADRELKMSKPDAVCDKVVLNLVSSPFHNRSLRRLHEVSLIIKIHRRHGLVADSKTVAPIP